MAALEKTEKEHAEDFLKVADNMTPEMKTKLADILEQKRYLEHKRYFKKFDDFLDSRQLNEPHWLKQPDIARFELENIKHYAERYFELYACCIMSNHVHLLIKMKPGAPILWKVLQDMKKYSGRQINKKLGRKGKFWEDESYDHLVRPGEFDRIYWYILNNPVKAKLVKEWQEYPFLYCYADVPPNPSSA